MRKERRREEEEREEEEKEEREEEEKEEREGAVPQAGQQARCGACTFRRRRSRQAHRLGTQHLLGLVEADRAGRPANHRRGDLLGLVHADRPARRGGDRRGLVGFTEAEAVIFL